MARAISYFVFSSTGSYLRWDDDPTIGFSINQYQMSITGGSSIDRLYAGAKTQVDATGLFASAGVDQLYFSGSFGDYTQTVSSSGVYTFTGMAGGAHAGEVMSFSMTSSGDTLVFADRMGTVQLSTYLNIQTNSFATILSSQLAAGAQTNPATGAEKGNAASKVFVFDSGGIKIPQLPIVGEAIAITGGSGIDSFYVRKGTNADATGLFASAGIDVLYLTGRFADYTQSVSSGGVYTFTRTFTGADLTAGLSEVVSFSLTSSGDKLVFADGGKTLQLSNYLSGSSFAMIAATDLDRNIVTPGLAPSLVLARDTGVNASDGITSNPTVYVTNLNPSSTWLYKVDDSPTWIPGTGSTFVGQSGMHTYDVQRIDGDVTTVAPSTVIYIIELALPVPPTLRLAVDSGSSTSDGITNNPTILVSGLGTGAVWQYQVDGSGSWVTGSDASFTATPGKHSYLVQQTDLAGNSNVSAVPTVITLDLVTPTITSPGPFANLGFAEHSTATITTLMANPNVADASEPMTITWTIAGGLDNLFFNLDPLTGALTFKVAPNYEVPQGGQYALTRPALTNNYTVNVVASDIAGNRSEATTLVVTVTDVNDAPTAVGTIPDQSGLVAYPFSLNVATAFSDADTDNTDAAAVGGRWGVLTYNASGLPNGLSINSSTGLISGQVTAVQTASPVTITATDGGGLSATQIFNLTITVAPVITGFSVVDTQTANGSALGRAGEPLVFTVTLSEAVTISGGVPQIAFNLNGNTVTASYSSGSGSATLVFNGATVPMGNGNNITLSSINLNGSTVTGTTSHTGLAISAVGQTYNGYTVANFVAAPALSLAVDSGVSSSDGITINPTINVSGLAVGASWQYQVDGSGSWNAGSGFSFTATSGVHNYAVRQLDLAGNTATSTPVIYTLDQTPPLAVNLSLVSDTGSSANDGLTSNPNINVARLELGASWMYQVDGGGWQSGTGLSFTATPGVHTYVAKQTDTAGNIGASSAPVVYTLSDSTPTTPSLSLSNDTGNPNDGITSNPTVIVGNLVSGASWQFSILDTTGAWLSGVNNSFSALNGTHTYSVRQIDVAGNVSLTSAPTVYVIDTEPINLTSSSFNVPENSLGNMVFTASKAAVTWMILPGQDSALFTLNGNVLSFISAPNYEMPRGSAFNAQSNNDTYTLTVQATDNVGNVVTQNMLVNVTDVNEAPVPVGSVPNQTAAQGVAYSFGVGAYFSDPDTGNTDAAATSGHWGTLVYTATGLPSGFSIDSRTGVVSGTASNAQTSNAVTVTATDGGSLSAVQMFTLVTVNAPVLSAFSVVDAGNGNGTTLGRVGEALTFTLSMSEVVTVDTTGGTPSITFNINNQPATANYVSGSGSATLIFTGAAVPASVSGNNISVTSISLNGGTVTGSVSGNAWVTNAVGQTYSGYTVDNLALSPTLSLASDTGVSAIDGITTNVTINVLGLKSGATWQYQVDSGAWQAGTGASFIASSGAHSYSVQQVDRAGNTSMSSIPVFYTIDQTPPVAPSLTLVSDTGVNASDGITTNPTIMVGGLEANSRWFYAVDPPQIPVWFNGTGMTFNASAGTHTYRVISVDVAGNTSSASVAKIYTLETVTVPTLSLALDSGSSAADGITNNPTIFVSNLDAGATWQYQVDGGSWQSTAATNSFLALSGAHSYSVREISLAGNTGAGSTPVSYTLDTTPPVASVVGGTIKPSATVSLQSNELGSAYLVNSTLTVNGLASLIASSSTLWSKVSVRAVNTPVSLPASGLVDGTYYVYTADLAGNFSAASSNSVIIDSTSPTIVSAAIVSASGTQNGWLSVGDIVTASVVMSKPVTVTGMPTLVLNIGGNLFNASFASAPNASTLNFVYTIQAGQNDSNGISIPANALSLGANASIVDVLNNNANLGLTAVADNVTYIVDTQPPAAPTLVLAVDSGASTSDGVTNNPTVNVNGLESAATTTWQYQVDGTAGAWINGIGTSFIATSGTHSYFVRQTDAAGNIGPSSVAKVFVVDNTVPAPVLVLVSDTGISASDNITNNPTINIFNLESGASWNYRVDTGSWQAGTGVAFVATTGIHSYSVQQVDLAGNTSVSSAHITVNYDNSLPSLIPNSSIGVRENTAIVSTLTAYQSVNGSIVTQQNNGVATPIVKSQTTWAMGSDGIHTDNAYFNISSSGILVFKSAPNYEMPRNSAYDANGNSNAYSISVQMTDAIGNVNTQSLLINVQDVNEVPFTLGTPQSQTILLNLPVSLTVTSYFGDPDILDTGTNSTTHWGDLTYTASGLPAGLSMSSSGQITGSPTALTPNAATVTLTATDGGGFSVTQTLSLSVVPGVTVQSFSVTDGNATNGNHLGRQGEPLTFTVSMSEAVTLTGITPNTPPTITFQINGVRVTASYLSGSGSDTLIFGGATATVPTGDGSEIFLTGINLHGAQAIGNVSHLAWNPTQGINLNYEDYTVDNTPPVAPTLSLAGDTGASANDGITNNATINVNLLEAAAGTTWQYKVDGSAWQPGTGASFTASSGAHSYFVQQTDVAGNTSPISTVLTYTLDTTVPAALSLSLASDTGTNQNDGLTSNATINVTGLETAAGTTWQYQVDGTAADSWQAGTGNSFFTASSGTHSYFVRQIDTAGNTGAASPVVTYTLDTSAPSAIGVAGTTGNVAENSLGAVTLTANANDVAANVSVTWSLGATSGANNDTGLFNLTNGVLSFKPANPPDFEMPRGTAFNASTNSNAYTVNVIATDAAGNATTQAIVVNVQDINETPVPKGTVPDQTATQDVAYSFNVSTYFSDPDSVNSYTAPHLQWGTLTYTTSNTLPSGFFLDSNTGVISGTCRSIVSPLSFTVTATDGGGFSTTQTFSLSVVAGVVVSSFSVSDSDGNTNFGKSGDSLTFTMTMSEAVHVAGGIPTITFNINGQSVIASYSGGSDTRTLTFTGTAPSGNGNSIRVGNIDLNGASVTALVNPSRNWNHTINGQTYGGYTLDNTTPMVSTIALTATTDNTPHSTVTPPVLGIGDVVTATVTMSEAVTVTGNPQLNLTIGATTVQASYAGGSGTSSLTFTYVILATQTDSNGISIPANALSGGSIQSLAGTSATLTASLVANNGGYLVDTSAPATPTLMLASDTGTNHSDHITNNATISVTGLESGATWQYQVDGAGAWTTATASGTSATFIAMSGAHSYTVQQTDLAGNTSLISTAVIYTLDTSAPATPTLSLVADSGTSGDNITSNATINVTGLESGATWQYRVDGSGWVSATASGTSATFIATSGAHSYTVQQTDLAGNTSTISAAFSVTLDTSTPAVSSIALTAATGVVNHYLNAGDVVTATVTMSGAVTVTGAPQLNLMIGGAPVQASYASARGTSLSTLIFTYVILAGDTDSNGISIPANALILNGATIQNLAGTSATVTSGAVADNADYLVDTTPPATPILALADDTGTNGDRITSNATINVTGLESGATWQYQVDGAGAWTTATASGTSATFIAMSGAHSYTVQQTDLAGNTSLISTAVIYTLDTSAPATPTLSLVADSGTSGDNITSNATINVTGLESGATWQYRVDGSGWVSATASGTSATFIATSGAHSYTVQQTDLAGNTSTISAAFSVTLDTSTPAVSSIALTAATGVVNHYLNAGDVVTATVTMSGAVTVTGAPQLNLMIGGAPVQASYASARGTSLSTLIFTYVILAGDTDSNGISIPANALILNGATIQNLAGTSATVTSGAVADNADYLVDTTPPATPILALADDTGTNGDRITSNATINVTGLESGATWQYRVDGSGWVSATASGASATFTATSGAHSYTVQQTDLAGNTSLVSTAVTYTLDAAAPAAPTLSFPNTGDLTRIGVSGLEVGATWTYQVDSSAGTSATVTNTNASISVTSDSALHTYTVQQTDVAGNTASSSVYLVQGTGTVAYTDTGALALASGNTLYVAGSAGVDTLSSVHTKSKFYAGAGNDTVTLQLQYGQGVSAWSGSVDGGAGTDKVTFDYTGATAATSIAWSASQFSSIEALDFSAATATTATTFSLRVAAVENASLDGKTWLSDGDAGLFNGRLYGALGAPTYQLKITGNQYLTVQAGAGDDWFALTPSSTTGIAANLQAAYYSRDSDVLVLIYKPASGASVQLSGGFGVAPTLRLASDTGSSTSDGITSNATINVSDLVSGNTWQYKVDSTGTWTTATASGISDSFTASSGAHTYFVQQSNAGSAGSISAFAYTLDTSASAPRLGLAADTGISGDNITNNPTINLTGLESGATWQYQVDGTTAGTWTPGTGSSFTATATDGMAHSYFVRQIDKAGNTSDPSTALIFTLNTTAPAVSSIVLTATDNAPLSTATPPVLGIGDIVTATVTMSEAVTVMGTPQLDLTIGNTTVHASYAGANGTSLSALIFTYVILANQTDSNGISIPADPLGLNDGGTIQNSVGTNAILTFGAVADNGDYRVDTTPPSALALSGVGTSVSFAENSTEAVGTLTANANDATPNASVTWALATGAGAKADNTYFSLSSAGELSFTTSPDYERPRGSAYNAASNNDSYTVNVVATDTAGNATIQNIVVNVTDVNDAPVRNGTVPDQTATQDVAYSFNVSSYFSDPDSVNTYTAPHLQWGTLTYTYTGTLPTGLTLSNAGVISGTVTSTASPATITVTATDGGSLSTTQTFSLGVVEGVVVSGFTVSDSVGNSNFGKSGDTLTFTMTMSERVTVNTTGGTPSINFSFIDESTGDPTLVTATYSGGTGSDTLTFTGRAPSGNGTAIRISAIALNNATVVATANPARHWDTTIISLTYAGYTLDNTLPSAPVLSFSPDGASDLTLIAVSGLVADTWTYQVDGGAGTSVSVTNERSSISVMSDSTLHTYTARQTDLAGNTSASSNSVYLIEGTGTVAYTDTSGLASATAVYVAGSAAANTLSSTRTNSKFYAGDGNDTIRLQLQYGQGFTAWTGSVDGGAGKDSVMFDYTNVTDPLPLTIAWSASKFSGIEAFDFSAATATTNFSLTADFAVEGQLAEYAWVSASDWGLFNGALYGADTRPMAQLKITGNQHLTVRANDDWFKLTPSSTTGIAENLQAAYYSSATDALVLIYKTASGSVLLSGGFGVAPTLSLASDTGSSHSDGITSNATINVSGLEAGASWQYKVDGSAWQAGTSATFNASSGAHTYFVQRLDESSDPASSISAFVYTLDTTAPEVSSIALTHATDNAPYSTSIVALPTPTPPVLGAGDIVTATVTMSKAVTVTGMPQLALLIGNNNTVQASYAGGSGTSSLIFTYTILSGQNDSEGISIPANALTLNSGTIQSLAGTNATNATLTSSLVADNPSYLVDTTAPSDLALSGGGNSVNFDENSTAAVGTLTANDASASASVTWALATGAGANADNTYFSLTSAGVLSFTTPPDYERPRGSARSDSNTDTYVVNVVATDAAGNATPQTITVNVQDINDAPVRNGTVSPQTARLGVAYRFDVHTYFSDPDTNGNPLNSPHESWGQLTYTATGLPTGLSISGGNGIISGTATSVASPVTVTVTATDGGNLSTTQTFTLGVTANLHVTAFTVSDSVGSTSVGKAGDPLTFTVTMSEAVTVTGTPTIAFAFIDDYHTAIPTITATYASGTGSSTLIFTATVPSGDGTNISMSTITLNGATVVATATPTLNWDTSVVVGGMYTSYTVDNMAPDAPALALAADTGSNTSDGVTNNPTVNVSGLDDGATWQYQVEGTAGTWTPGTGSSFTATATDGMAHSYFVRQIDKAGNTSDPSTALIFTLNTTAPAVSSIVLTATDNAPLSTATPPVLGIGDIVTATVTMSEAVTVMGTPQLDLTIGNTTVHASYAGANGTSLSALIFTYVILANQTDSNGISIPANALVLNGATIQNLAGTSATVTSNLVADNPSYLVDTTAEALSLALQSDASTVMVSGLETGATWEYQRDGTAVGSWTPGTGSSFTISAGSHTYFVRQTDLAGNVSDFNHVVGSNDVTYYGWLVDKGADIGGTVTGRGVGDQNYQNTIAGGNGNDTLMGNDKVTLTQGSSINFFFGGAGNDIIALGDGDAKNGATIIDGGSGIDTIRLGVTGDDLNISTSRSISSIERIDLRADSHRNILTLTLDNVLNMTGDAGQFYTLAHTTGSGWTEVMAGVLDMTKHQLVIDGVGGTGTDVDEVHLGSGFTLASSAGTVTGTYTGSDNTSHTTTYNVYNATAGGLAQVLIDVSITPVL